MFKNETAIISNRSAEERTSLEIYLLICLVNSNECAKCADDDSATIFINDVVSRFVFNVDSC